MRKRIREFFRRNSPALGSGLLLTLSFPNVFHPEFFKPGVALAWISLVPLLLGIERAAPATAWRQGYACGLLFFLLSLAWINNVLPMGPAAVPAWLALSAYCALYPAAFAWGLAWGRSKGMRLEALWVPALWTLLEALREWFLSGFPWVSLGSSQALNPWLLPLVSVTGVYGLHFTLALSGLVLAGLWRRRAPAPEAFALALALAAMTLHGHSPKTFKPGPDKMQVAVLQGNINQDQAWTEDYRHEILNVYGGLTEEAIRGGAELVIWPESTFPGFFNEMGPEAQALIALARNRKVSLMAGSSMTGPGDVYYNGVVFIDPGGNTLDYKKRHLVPFGEFIPLSQSIPLLSRVMRQMGLAEFRPGTLAQEFQAGKGQLGALVCYESVFGGLARRTPGQVLVIVTLDTWFGDSAAPRLHLMHAMLRAAESGRWVLRAAATGISAIISPQGEIMGQVQLNTRGWLQHWVNFPKSGTPYLRYGNWLLLPYTLLLLLPYIFRKPKKD